MARSFRGGLTGLRLRRPISFLRRNRLHTTAHALERRSGVFFDAAHLRRMILEGRWAAASSYSLRFVTVGNCSSEAEALNVRILILRVIADFAAGRVHSVDSLFQRMYANLDAYKERQAIRKILLSMRSDETKSSILYHRLKPKAVKVIMDLVAKCPELEAKARLPRSTFDPAYNMSLGPGLWEIGNAGHTTGIKLVASPPVFLLPVLSCKRGLHISVTRPVIQILQMLQSCTACWLCR